MADTPSSRLVPLEQTRQRVIDHLAEHYAYDNLNETQLEDRLERAARAATLEELRELVADLPALRPETGMAPAPGGGERAGAVRDRQAVVAVMSGAARKGRWTPPKKLVVVAVMGGVELDFREARFGTGITEIQIFTMMGGVEIIVPPGVDVDMGGMAFMGAFDERPDNTPVDPSAPIIRIGGFAMMGGVEVSYRYPGERAKDARKRVKEEGRLRGLPDPRRHGPPWAHRDDDD